MVAGEGEQGDPRRGVKRGLGGSFLVASNPRKNLWGLRLYRLNPHAAEF
jgi:hypothetical protein